MNSKAETSFGVLLHLLTYLNFAFPSGGLIAVLVFWLLKRGNSDYVDSVGKEVLNFQITLILVTIGCIILAVTIVGIPLVYLLGFIYLLLLVFCPAVGAIKTSNGKEFRYPLTIRLLR